MRLCFSNQGTLPGTFFLEIRLELRQPAPRSDTADVRWLAMGSCKRWTGGGVEGQFCSPKLTNANCSGTLLTPLLVSYEDLRFPCCRTQGPFTHSLFVLLSALPLSVCHICSVFLRRGQVGGSWDYIPSREHITVSQCVKYPSILAWGGSLIVSHRTGWLQLAKQLLNPFLESQYLTGS